MPLPDGRPTAGEVATGVPHSGDRYNPYAIHPQVVKRTREAVEVASRKARRRSLALAAQVTYLAVMDPESGASTQDRLKAADGAARVSGLVRDESRVVVEHRVSFRGLARGLPSVTREAIEARVVEATAIPPSAPSGEAPTRLPACSGASGDGAAGALPGTGGGGG